jgi:hypothetical protein
VYDIKKPRFWRPGIEGNMGISDLEPESKFAIRKLSISASLLHRTQMCIAAGLVTIPV